MDTATGTVAEIMITATTLLIIKFVRRIVISNTSTNSMIGDTFLNKMNAGSGAACVSEKAAEEITISALLKEKKGEKKNGS